MRWSQKVLLLVALSCVMATSQAAGYWQDAKVVAQRSGTSNKPAIAKVNKGRYLQANINIIRQQLLDYDETDIELPLPDGQMAVFRLENSPIAEQGLLEKYPEIKTFFGVDVNNSNNRGRFDISPAGFRAMFKYEGDTIYIDPQFVGEESRYIAYYVKDARAISNRLPDEVITIQSLIEEKERASRALLKGNTDGALRVYRLAVAATKEYTNFFGGGVSDGLSAIVTAINRVNVVYENDLGIRLELVADNNLIIHTDSNPGPYLNDAFEDVDLNQANIDNLIGSGNYDIGHLFGLGSGGIASLGVVCDDFNKAGGATGLDFPTGDSFYIDFVAHEIGHQFGAYHTFNGTSGSCGGANRSALAAFEPGSGSTIMAYAGICDDEDLQNNSDAYFHAHSINEISDYVSTGGGSSCGTVVPLGGMGNPNTSVPDVEAGLDIVVPVSTPFILSPLNDATDADLDTLIYTWEQMDLGDSSCSPATMADNGNRPIFRSFEPSTDTDRYLPRLSNVVGNTTLLGESYVTTNRILDFRLTVRDGNGATGHDDKRVSVTTSAGPFIVTSPELGAVWSAGFEQVDWNVAGTDSGLVNCPLVDILLSTNNGVSFPIQLSTSIANDGNELVSVPMGVSGPVRVMVRCSDNRFYAVSGSRPILDTGSVSLASCRQSSSGGGGSTGPIALLLLTFLFFVTRKKQVC